MLYILHSHICRVHIILPRVHAMNIYVTVTSDKLYMRKVKYISSLCCLSFNQERMFLG